jgi:hypothetical protein
MTSDARKTITPNCPVDRIDASELGEPVAGGAVDARSDTRHFYPSAPEPAVSASRSEDRQQK